MTTNEPSWNPVRSGGISEGQAVLELAEVEVLVDFCELDDEQRFDGMECRVA